MIPLDSRRSARPCRQLCLLCAGAATGGRRCARSCRRHPLLRQVPSLAASAVSASQPVNPMRWAGPFPALLWRVMRRSLLPPDSAEIRSGLIGIALGGGLVFGNPNVGKVDSTDPHGTGAAQPDAAPTPATDKKPRASRNPKRIPPRRLISKALRSTRDWLTLPQAGSISPSLEAVTTRTCSIRRGGRSGCR